MAIKLSATVRDGMLDAITTAVGTSALWRIYSGSQPATPETTTVIAQLAELTCSSTFAPGASTTSNVLTLNPITQDSSADATGTAAWFRIAATGAIAGAAGFIDGSVSTSSADLNLNSTSITTGAIVQITAATFTAGNA